MGRNDGSRIHVIDKIYADAINELTDARIEFLIGDRFYLKQMELGSGKPVHGTPESKEARLVRGPFSFRKLVLPPLDILTLASARAMVVFAKAGGYVYALGELPAASAENWIWASSAMRRNSGSTARRLARGCGGPASSMSAPRCGRGRTRSGCASPTSSITVTATSGSPACSAR